MRVVLFGTVSESLLHWKRVVCLYWRCLHDAPRTDSRQGVAVVYINYISSLESLAQQLLNSASIEFLITYFVSKLVEKPSRVNKED